MKYHICREKMQLSRAKPGNPASNIYACMHAHHIMHTHNPKDPGAFIDFGMLLTKYNSMKYIPSIYSFYRHFYHGIGN